MAVLIISAETPVGSAAAAVISLSLSVMWSARLAMCALTSISLRARASADDLSSLTCRSAISEI